jgi:hypothetical protein
MVQSLDPWLSTSMEKGVRSGAEISGALENARAGIICLTPENLREPWINFEAGALSKAPEIHVCTVLLDLAPGDVEAPLAQFQHTLATREEILALTLTLAALARQHTDWKATDQDISNLFVKMWPDLEAHIEDARKLQGGASTPARSLDDKVEEILERVRQLAPRPTGAFRTVFGSGRRVSEINPELIEEDRLLAAELAELQKEFEDARRLKAGGDSGPKP